MKKYLLKFVFNLFIADVRKHIFIYDLICRDFALILFNYNTLLIDPVAFLLKGQNLHYYLLRYFNWSFFSLELLFCVCVLNKKS